MKKGIVIASNDELRNWYIGYIRNGDTVVIKKTEDLFCYFQKKGYEDYGFYCAPKEYVKIIEQDNTSKINNLILKIKSIIKAITLK